MCKSILTILATISFISVGSTYAGEQCVKVYGNTPEEAFQVAAQHVEQQDAALGPGWAEANLRIRLLPEKENEQFVAVVYTTLPERPCDLGVQVVDNS